MNEQWWLEKVMKQPSRFKKGGEFYFKAYKKFLPGLVSVWTVIWQHVYLEF